jgi:hypothetical protein
VKLLNNERVLNLTLGNTVVDKHLRVREEKAKYEAVLIGGSVRCLAHVVKVIQRSDDWSLDICQEKPKSISGNGTRERLP